MSSWTGAGSGADSVSSWNGAGFGVDSVSSWNGAGSGVDSVSSWNGAGSGVDWVSSWNGAGSGVELVFLFLLNLRFSVGSEGQGWWENPCGRVLNDEVLPTDSDDGDISQSPRSPES